MRVPGTTRAHPARARPARLAAERAPRPAAASLPSAQASGKGTALGKSIKEGGKEADADSSDDSRGRRKVKRGSLAGAHIPSPSEMKAALLNAFKNDDAKHAKPAFEKKRSSLEHMGGKLTMGKADFEANLAKDNASRGATNRNLQPNEDLNAIARVEESDPAVTTLELSASAQFCWLSQSQKLAALERVAGGTALTTLLLDSLQLDNSHAAPIAAAVKRHARLEKLSVDSNSFAEPALLSIAAACVGHPALFSLSVANQKVGAITQPAILALIEVMEGTPRLTRLNIGHVKDNTLRLRLEAASVKSARPSAPCCRVLLAAECSLLPSAPCCRVLRADGHRQLPTATDGHRRPPTAIGGLCAAD